MHTKLHQVTPFGRQLIMGIRDSGGRIGQQFDQLDIRRPFLHERVHQGVLANLYQRLEALGSVQERETQIQGTEAIGMGTGQ